MGHGSEQGGVATKPTVFASVPVELNPLPNAWLCTFRFFVLFISTDQEYFPVKGSSISLCAQGLP